MDDSPASCCSDKKQSGDTYPRAFDFAVTKTTNDRDYYTNDNLWIPQQAAAAAALVGFIISQRKASIVIHNSKNGAQ